MPMQPAAISPRFDEHTHILGWGEGWKEHMRLIGGHLYYFTRGFQAEGYTTNRAYTRVPGTTWGEMPTWRLIHELRVD